MNVREGAGHFRTTLFQVAMAVRRLLPRQPIQAFGNAEGKITGILVINLDRQPTRWRRIQRELGRFKTVDGTPLGKITSRLPAIDARDGRETAPTADVDPIYRLQDQLFVQPDERLAACFGPDEPIRMTRQEIAVARSHIEAWKRIASGTEQHVLILEDDAYFVPGAAGLIDRGWRAARQLGGDGPHLLYISYLDAGGTAQRADISADTFRPVRGLWYLSGYVLSKSGAEHLLRSMPVVGPVDLWINRRFAEMDVLALARSALMQRPDGGSDNSYSIVPYLARSGVVDAGPAPVRPPHTDRGVVFAWNAPGDTDVMGMALSMLGYRVRTCSGALTAEAFRDRSGHGSVLFDAYVDAHLDQSATKAVLSFPEAKFVVMDGVNGGQGAYPTVPQEVPPSRTLALRSSEIGTYRWEPLCHLLGLPVPDHDFPSGTRHEVGLFRVEHDHRLPTENRVGARPRHDESPWVLPQHHSQPTGQDGYTRRQLLCAEPVVRADLSAPSPAFRAMTETFPGNLATFEPSGVKYVPDGAALTLRVSSDSIRRYSSGALASRDTFHYGRFEAEIKAASGAGLVTGFFLHRDAPRQEIDVELVGSDPLRMLVNVYFNPGDEGTALSYGYRGTPYLVDLGFDASLDFHIYTVEWTPAEIRWLVDDQVVHSRSRWNPTPIPHLPLRLHANLWSPRSVELAGRLDEDDLPARSLFRRITVRPLESVEGEWYERDLMASDKGHGDISPAGEPSTGS